jgi:hypothetical protein
MKTAFQVLTLLSLLPLANASVFAQEASRQEADSPLAPFERLVGGQWHLGDSYQEFEWGVGKKSVKVKSFFLVEGSPHLVSEGIWFWHPGEGKIRGIATAIDMPVSFFDYTTRFEGNNMVSDLRSFDASGVESSYVEVFELTGEDEYVWTLMTDSPQGLQEVMGGTYVRR